MELSFRSFLRNGQSLPSELLGTALLLLQQHNLPPRQGLPSWVKPGTGALTLRKSLGSGEEEKVFCDLLMVATIL